MTLKPRFRIYLSLLRASAILEYGGLSHPIQNLLGFLHALAGAHIFCCGTQLNLGEYKAVPSPFQHSDLTLILKKLKKTCIYCRLPQVKNLQAR